MTRDQIIERVKALMHLGDRSDLSPTDEALLEDIATAIVDMLGPKGLRWVNIEKGEWIVPPYGDHFIEEKAGAFWWPSEFGRDDADPYPTLDAAKAAAQAHHEEQHWMRTRIWEDD